MAEKAAHLVDHVFPSVPFRQWVLTLPPPLRYLVAYDSSLCSAVLTCFIRAVFCWQRHKAKTELGLGSVKEAHPAAATVIQRSGSALNLNVHFHTAAADGVFVQTQPDEAPVFRALPAPSPGEIASVAWDACQRTLAVLRKRGLWLDNEPGEDNLSQDSPALAALANASIQGTLILGPNAGRRVMRFRGEAPSESAQEKSQPCQTPGYPRFRGGRLCT